MKNTSNLIKLFSVVLLLTLSACSADDNSGITDNKKTKIITLPPAALSSNYSLEETIYKRVSGRNFSEEAINLQQAAQLLWAAQGQGIDGISGATRTAPSAGATYPLEVYLLVGNVENITPGLYRYSFTEHSLHMLSDKDKRKDLASAALNQQFIAEAPAVIILAAEYSRTTGRYGDRGIRYVHMEVGHVTQNIYLQCEALGLGTVAIGAFKDQVVQLLLEIAEEPLMIIPIGILQAP